MDGTEALLCPLKEDSEKKKKLILFVCTGNTCRSPMAAALFNQLYGGVRHAASAGLSADGSPISDKAVEALMERGILPAKDNDYTRHISRQIDDEALAEAEMVIGLSSAHAVSLLMRYPEYATKITSLPDDIPDPFGGGIEEYRRCLKSIEDSLGKVFAPDASGPASE